MLDYAHMKARSATKKKATKRPVQVSLDTSLVRKIDADSESRRDGRSAYITNAILLYMRAKREKLIDDQLVAALSATGVPEGMSREAAPFIASQDFGPDDDLVEDHGPRRRRATKGR